MAKIKTHFKILKFLALICVIIVSGFLLAASFLYFINRPSLTEMMASVNVLSGNSVLENSNGSPTASATSNVAENPTSTAITAEQSVPEIPPVTHVTVPNQVKSLYMTSWVAGTPRLRDKVVSLIDKSEINAVVVDIKDYTGKLAFVPNDPALVSVGCYDKRISDVDGLLKYLHEKNIYVIGRVATFQDPCMVKQKPQDSVQTKAGEVWRDKKGITWLDAGNKNVWDYFVSIANESYARGFDEIQFDYIRFPTDGNMRDISFPAAGTTSKAVVIGNFLKYLDKNLRGGLGANYVPPPKKNPTSLSASTTIETVPEIPHVTSVLGSPIYNLDEYNATTSRLMISADVFGLVTEGVDDMGIGQHLEDILPYVDYLSPMVYPSHYATGYSGFPKPAKEPYKVVFRAMSEAVRRAKKMGQNPLKLRPWLQDFNLGATYTPEMVLAQIQATRDAGLNSWLLWGAANKFSASSVFLKANKAEKIVEVERLE
jgi:hypothetical protein